MVEAAPAEGPLRIRMGQDVREPPVPAKVERGAADPAVRAVGDQLGVDGGVEGGLYLEVVGQDVATPLSFEVPVGVVGEVDDRRRVGDRLVRQGQVVIPVQRVGDADVQGTGESLVAVGAVQEQADTGAVRGVEGFAPPHALVEPVGTAVQRVPVLLGGKPVGDAVEDETATRDAVGITAHRRAEVAC